MKITWSNYSLVMLYVSELLQSMVNYYSKKLRLSFFHSSYCFLPPIELIETRVFSVITGFDSDDYHELDSFSIFKIGFFYTNADFIFDKQVQLSQLFTSSALLAQSRTKDFTPL